MPTFTVHLTRTVQDYLRASVSIDAEDAADASVKALAYVAEHDVPFDFDQCGDTLETDVAWVEEEKT